MRGNLPIRPPSKFKGTKIMEPDQAYMRPSRRRALTLLGLLAFADRTSAQAAPRPDCVPTPTQTEGPYFVDERLKRSDIRTDPADGVVSAGVPLALQLRILALSSAGCAPLAGAMVDIWHCDAAGRYSDAEDAGFDTRGKAFLRGYQLTDANGLVRFMTIYPGWYPGRTVHIHVKVRAGAASGRHREFTSQLYFDDALTDRVHARQPYANRGRRTTRNRQDGIFRDGGPQLLLAPIESGAGYAANYDIGLDMR
jgi:protocatechuate 3,4-dioxygenase beta subunit